LGRKNSRPINYNFTEPTKNLHQGKSATGKDFRTPIKKGSYQAQQSIEDIDKTNLDNLIDDLFGSNGSKLALGPQW
jgi:hypothetical protein